MSDILDNFEILQASITAKYHIQVMLLFVYWKTRNLPVMHRRPLFITVEKTNTGFCIPNNLFTSMKKKKGPIVFCKTITNR